MFCPQCRAEYRPGFSRCSDCDVELVEELPEPGTKSRHELRVVWKGDNQTDCVDVCIQLRDLGIGYDVVQEVAGLAPAMDVDWRYEVRVASEDYGRAREALTPESPTVYESNDETAFQLPANEIATATRPSADRSRRRKWRPSEALVEVCSRKPGDTSIFVELSLKTNLIPFRIEENEGGARTFLVAPEDETRARDVIRQIHDGAPPE